VGMWLVPVDSCLSLPELWALLKRYREMFARLLVSHPPSGFPEETIRGELLRLIRLNLLQVVLHLRYLKQLVDGFDLSLWVVSHSRHYFIALYKYPLQ
jgi:hypothetical protein